MQQRRWPLYSFLVFGYAFLYVPVLLLIIYSFNESRLVTVWSGFSTKWYAALLENTHLLDAAWLSIRVAATNATVAVVLGTLAANALVRHGRFKGRTGFEMMITAPLVMPEVIVGLSMLLLFVALEQWVGWPDGRGFTTIVITHITFSMAYVAVVVKARLGQMDRSLEEAAMDLGARPLKVYLRITLPLTGPTVGLAARLHPIPGRPGSDQLRRRARVHHPAHGGLLQRAHGGLAPDQRPGHPDRPLRQRRGDRRRARHARALAVRLRVIAVLLFKSVSKRLGC
jgi:putrescine transport system permease protein